MAVQDNSANIDPNIDPRWFDPIFEETAAESQGWPVEPEIADARQKLVDEINADNPSAADDEKNVELPEPVQVASEDEVEAFHNGLSPRGNIAAARGALRAARFAALRRDATAAARERLEDQQIHADLDARRQLADRAQQMQAEQEDSQNQAS